jgi:peptide/nickel transport system ATP-binding protein
MSDPILEINDLKASFKTYEGTADVLDGIDLTIREGEAMALVGETGCGKSLTTELILDLVPAARTSGEMKFKDEVVYSSSVDERSSLRGENISIIMQDPMSSLNPVFTIGEQMTDILLFGGDKSGPIDYLKYKLTRNSAERREARERAKEVLNEVQISSPERVLSSYPSELSGGMRQRILIGMALLADPDLLIADEPGTALDVTTEKKILEILKDIVDNRDTSVIYITHDLGVAHEVSDRVTVMYAGQVVERSPTDIIFDTPMHPYTRTLLESVPSLSTGIGEGSEGSIPSYVDVEAECRFADRCEFSEAACRGVHPNERNLEGSQSVACHLYEHDTRSRSDNGVDEPYIGPPPWKTEQKQAD